MIPLFSSDSAYCKNSFICFYLDRKQFVLSQIMQPEIHKLTVGHQMD